jgi:hypothetical protein
MTPFRLEFCEAFPALDNTLPFSHDTPGMDDSRLKRSYLETLTTSDLVKLADRYAIDIPPDLDRVFIIEELLDLETELDFGREAESSLVETGIPEPVPLPKQYNITFIEIMIRDPLWVFVYWEIKTYDRALYENAYDFGGYQLKVSPLGVLPPSGVQDPETDASFVVAVENGDTAWYLGFPPSGGRFKVELCVIRGDETLVLAASRPFRLPKMLDPPNSTASGIDENPLIRLSGLDELPVLRNTDRQSRVPRCCE